MSQSLNCDFTSLLLFSKVEDLTRAALASLLTIAGSFLVEEGKLNAPFDPNTERSKNFLNISIFHSGILASWASFPIFKSFSSFILSNLKNWYLSKHFLTCILQNSITQFWNLNLIWMKILGMILYIFKTKLSSLKQFQLAGWKPASVTSVGSKKVLVTTTGIRTCPHSVIPPLDKYLSALQLHLVRLLSPWPCSLWS